MKRNVAVISAIIENPASVEELNRLLTSYRDFIIGRLGLPYREKDISIVTVVLDAPADVIAALTEKIGALDGAAASTACAAEK